MIKSTHVTKILLLGNKKQGKGKVSKVSFATHKIDTSELHVFCNNLYLHMISGLGLSRDISWDQKRGMEPRCCTTELICPVPRPIPVSSFITNCSVSTSFATRPLSFTPLFKYLQIMRKWKHFISCSTILSKNSGFVVIITCNGEANQEFHQHSPCPSKMSGPSPNQSYDKDATKNWKLFLRTIEHSV